MTSSGTLSNQDIAKIISEADREMERKGVNEGKRLRFRIILEEILLFYHEEAGAEAPVKLDLRKKGESFQIGVIVSSEPLDPFTDTQKKSPVLASVLKKWEHPGYWQYFKGSNVVTFELPLFNTLRQNLRFTWFYTKQQKGYFVMGVTSQLISVVLRIISPLIMARIIIAFTSNAFEQLVLAALAIFATDLVSSFVLFACNRAYNIVYNKTLTELETDLVDSVLRITNQCVEEKGSGLFIQRLTQDTSRLATGFNTMADMVSETFRYFGILAAMLIISPPIFCLVFFLIGIQTAIELIRARKMNADDRIYRNANERYTGFVGEMVRGMKDVKLFHVEKNFKEELRARIKDANAKRMKMQNRAWFFRLSREVVGSIGFLALTILLGFLISRSMMAAATALVLYNYYTNLGSPFALLIGQTLEFFKDFNLSSERVYAIMNNPEFLKEEFGTVHLEKMRGEICFDHVNFAYKRRGSERRNRMILKDISFKVEPGETVALVGRSGSGKSTVFNLITKLYEANSGVVSLDGVDIAQLDSDSIRGNMAVVTQHPYIFNMSIRDNLRLVKPDMTEEEMREACRKACIDTDIRRMSEGYDTILDEGGTDLSGGQRQRIAIARALLINSKVLLMDEATSALDNVTQSQIGSAIRNIKHDRTIIMIAHRLSTIMNADRIMYLQNGSVLDQGTHEELLKRCAPYRELYETEAGRQETDKKTERAQ